VDLEKMLREELPGALGKLSGAELTKFRVEFILAMNEATITLPGGGVMRARGTATVGQRCYVRDGRIEGPAPTLTYVSGEA